MAPFLLGLLKAAAMAAATTAASKAVAGKGGGATPIGDAPPLEGLNLDELLAKAKQPMERKQLAPLTFDQPTY